MSIFKMTKTTETEEQRQTSRKSTVWTREKIAQLIQLYHKHECLWNHYTEKYKSKESRNKSIVDICIQLNITKFEFGKKIHNLRNQFNSEMKKLERRMEEAGGNVAELTAGQRCRWEHFESLMFLRSVIEPRPGGYQTGFPQPKKRRLKYDYNSEEDVLQFDNRRESNTTTTATEDVTEYHFEEATAEHEETLTEQLDTDEYQNYDEEIITTVQREDSYDQKYNPPAAKIATTQAVTITTLPTQTTKTYFTKVHNVQQKPTQQQQQPSQAHQQEVIQLEDTHHTQNLSTGAVIELPAAATSSPSTIEQQAFVVSNRAGKRLSRDGTSFTTRDQWDAFGELIASEFRNLNSDISRKKLKRKIMQAMLEVGEDDDHLSMNVTMH